MIETLLGNILNHGGSGEHGQEGGSGSILPVIILLFVLWGGWKLLNQKKDDPETGCE